MSSRTRPGTASAQSQSLLVGLTALAMLGAVASGCGGQDDDGVKVVESSLGTDLEVAKDELAAEARAQHADHVAVDPLGPITTPAWGGAEPLALVTIFSDFQCSHCFRARGLPERLTHAFGADVQVHFRHLPLGQSHPHATVSAAAAMAAHRQGKWRAYYDALFEMRKVIQNQPDPNDVKQILRSIAVAVGMDVLKYDNDLQGGTSAAPGSVNPFPRSFNIPTYVEDDRVLAMMLGARQTPTVLVNGRLVERRKGLRVHGGTIRLVREEIAAGKDLLKQGVERATIPGVRISENLGQRRTELLLGSADFTKQERDRYPKRAAAKFIRYKVDLRGDEPSRGASAEDALVTVVEFSDLECPFCSRIGPTLDVLVAKYPYVRVVFKHLPLPFHKRAVPAALASQCAHVQGKFWPYHDLIFANQKSLSDADLEGYATASGLDMAAWKTCLTSPAAKAAIDADKKQAAALGVSGTPNSFVNGVHVRGAAAPATFAKAVLKERAWTDRFTSGGPNLRGPALYKAVVASGKAAVQGRRSSGGGASKEVKKVTLDGDEPAFGATNPLVTVVEFSDFTCGFCRKITPTLKSLVENNPDDVRVVFKHFPRNTDLMAIASECANQQGKFWEFHDEIFANGSRTEPDLDANAKDTNLDMAAWRACRESPDTRAKVSAQKALGQSVGVRGTPNSFVNGRQVTGAQPLAVFQKTVDEEIAKAKKLEATHGRGKALYDFIVSNPGG